MKQFFRYLSLIACVLVIGVWGWSYFYANSFSYSQIRGLYLTSANGKVRIIYGVSKIALKDMGDQPGFHWYQNSTSVYLDHSQQIKPNFKLPGVLSYVIDNLNSWELGVYISYWLLFTPLFLLTLKLWYHPIKNWWRDTDRQGFAVEMVDKNEQHPTPEAKE